MVLRENSTKKKTEKENKKPTLNMEFYTHPFYILHWTSVAVIADDRLYRRFCRSSMRLIERLWYHPFYGICVSLCLFTSSSHTYIHRMCRRCRHNSLFLMVRFVWVRWTTNRRRIFSVKLCLWIRVRLFFLCILPVLDDMRYDSSDGRQSHYVRQHFKS